MCSKRMFSSQSGHRAREATALCGFNNTKGKHLFCLFVFRFCGSWSWTDDNGNAIFLGGLCILFEKKRRNTSIRSYHRYGKDGGK